MKKVVSEKWSVVRVLLIALLVLVWAAAFAPLSASAAVVRFILL